MSLVPPFIAPALFDDADAALARVREIYDASVDHLRVALQSFVNGAAPAGRVRACYPFVRVHTDTVARADSRLSYGFVAGPGTYETTLTRPDLFASYYREQFRLLLENHGVSLEVGTSVQPVPVHFSFAEHDHIEGSLTPERRLLLRDLFDLPDLGAMDDGIANGTYVARAGEAHPLALFTAPRVDYSLHRLRHYTGTDPEHFQNFVLFTNYQFYIDEFVRLGHEAMAGTSGSGDYEAFVEPGNVIERRTGAPARPGDELGAAPPRLPQMPAYHLVRDDGSGITMVNIGVGPANAKTITDHIAVLRPHAWVMLGHCAGLRNTQQLGDYVLAHGYVREDHVLDEDLPLWVPIPALAEVQVALEKAVAEVTQLKGYELKRIMRTGTVASTDNRNWELLPSRHALTTPERRFSQSRAIALDMESATIAANGFRFRVPVRHAALRQRQAAARRDQAAGDGEPLLPRARRPAPAHRRARDRAAARGGRRPAAQPQAAQLRRSGVPVGALGGSRCAQRGVSDHRQRRLAPAAGTRHRARRGRPGLSVNASAARFSRRCASLAAFGIAITPGCATSQARASCAGVAPRWLASLRKRGVAGQAALVDRRVGHRHHAVLLQPGHEREARAALAQRVVDLVGRAALAAAQATSSSMSSTSKLLTPQWRIRPRERSVSKASTVSCSGTLPRQCSR